MERYTIERVNSMGFQEFTEEFGSVIEHTPLVAAAVWSHRPFTDLQNLHGAFCAFISQLQPETAKIGIIRCHPDLAGKLANAGTLTSESTKEQKSAGLLELTEIERKELTAINERYKQKFSFPFVICARENKKQAIFEGIRTRLGNTVDDEVNNAVQEVNKIAWYRLADIVCEEKGNF